MSQRGLLRGGDMERHLKEEKERTLGKGMFNTRGTARAKALGWIYAWNVPENTEARWLEGSEGRESDRR